MLSVTSAEKRTRKLYKLLMTPKPLSGQMDMKRVSWMSVIASVQVLLMHLDRHLALYITTAELWDHPISGSPKIGLIHSNTLAAEIAPVVNGTEASLHSNRPMGKRRAGEKIELKEIFYRGFQS